MSPFKEVNFYRIPTGLTFRHQGEFYTKIEEEKVIDASGKEWVFEVHYGCIVHESLISNGVINPE